MAPRGGRGGRGRGRGRGNGRSNGSSSGQGDRAIWNKPVEDIQVNPVFEAFYIDQGIVSPDEWPSFMRHLRAALPTSFRITSGKPTTTLLLEQMRDFYLPYLSNVPFEGEKIPPPKAMPWYPDDMAWQIDVKKNALRKTEQFKKFQHFLVHETEVGNISRQETVSMIPPLFLDVEPHHIVLDMCAAPGSKTAQLIEALHSPLTSSAESYDPMPPGIVIANDSDAKRAHMLVHQSARLPSPNIVVANCDASRWPSIRVPWLAKGAAKAQERTLKFDRILADVPCSGDGTLRKNLAIWQDWHPHNGAALHPLQLRILLRGLANLRNGGRLVYSTCSLNPIEDEAVVAAALRECNGTVQLIDQSHAFPSLIRRKGLTYWKVCPTRGKQKLAGNSTKKVDAEENAQDEKEEKHGGDTATSNGASSSYRDGLPELPYAAKFEDISTEMQAKVPKTLWPQGDEEALGLDRCMRILPQDQNTGGFFVAVLEKKDGTEADLAEGMAYGMARAVALRDRELDSEAATAAASTASAAATKRPRSPTAVDVGEASIKRLREEETAGPNDVSAAATSDAVTTADADRATEPSHAQNGSKPKEEVGNPGGMPYKEDPMVYVDKDHEQTDAIATFFGLDKSFDRRNLMVRNKDGIPLRSVYLTGTAVRGLISSGGPGRGDHPYGNPLKLRLLNCGVRAFARQDSGKDPSLKCRWRVTSDAIPVLRPLVEESKVLHATVEDFHFLTSNHYPKLSDLPDTPFRKNVESIDTGSHLIDIAPGNFGEHKLDRSLCVPIWRAPASVHLMLERQEKSALSYRVFGSDLSNPSGDRQFAQSRVQMQATQLAAREKLEAREQKRNDAAASSRSSGPQNGVAIEVDEDALQDLENSARSAVASGADGGPAEEAITGVQIEEEGQELPADAPGA